MKKRRAKRPVKEVSKFRTGQVLPFILPKDGHSWGPELAALPSLTMPDSRCS